MGKDFKRLEKEIINCRKCSLFKERKRHGFLPVIGEGSKKAKIMLIGEAPGFNEAKTGHPFCGRAGEILDILLSSAGIKREDIYITNLLKDRPPSNRAPKKEEIKACGKFLEKQIELIKPKIICPLGNFATAFILKKYGFKTERISKIHGKIISTNSLKIIPFYHPAVAVYMPKMISVLKNDFKILKKFKK